MQIIIRKEGYIATPDGKHVRIGSRRDEKAMGVSRIEEIRDRAKDANRNKFKRYEVSDQKRKLQSEVKQISRPSDRFIEKHMPMHAEMMLAAKQGRRPKWEARGRRK